MQVKTVVIVNDFNYTQGGASKVAIDTAIMLKQVVEEVYFFSAVNKEEDNIVGIKYISTHQNEALKEKNKLKGIINGIYNQKAKKDFKSLLKTLDRESTIIHIHGWTKALSCSIFQVAFQMNFKVVLTLHDYFTACLNGGYFDYKKNEICSLKPLSLKCMKCNCDSRNYIFKLYRIVRQLVQNKIIKLNKKLEHVITISEFSEKILQSTLGKHTTITRILNPIDVELDTEKVDPTKNRYYLYVGRVSKEKGVDLFCEAMEQLGYQAIVVGEGEEKEKLEKRFPTIEFTGWKNKEETKAYMKGAKALIAPSRWYEGALLTPLEAMQYGIPCLTSNVCAAVDYVSNNGRTFALNVEDLKKQIVEYEKNIPFYSENAFIYMHEKRNNQYKEQIIELYEKMLEGNKN